MNRRRYWLMLALVLCLAGTASAGTTDIRTLRTKVFKAASTTLCSATPPVVGQLTCLTVVVQNLGPDTYFGTASAAPGKPAGGSLSVTVDIDEPTKPGTDPVRIAASFTQSFAVTIAPGDSAECSFGVVNWTPMTGATHLARSTSTASGTNSDPDHSNDTASTVFFVYTNTPAVGWVGLTASILGVATAGAWVLRRRTRTVRAARG